MEIMNSEIRKLYCLAKPYKKLYMYGILFTVALYGITFAIPIQIKRFIDTGLSSDSMSVILPIVGLIVVLKAIIQIFNISMHYYFTMFESIFTRNTQRSILEHIMNIEISKLKAFSVGDTISRVNDDVKAIERFMAVDLSGLIKNWIVALIGIGVLFYLSVPLTLAALPLLIVVPFCMDLVKKKVRAANDKIRYSNGRVVSTIEQILSGLYIIRSHSYKSLFIQEYMNNANSIVDNRKKMAVYQGISGAIAEIVIALIMFGVVFGFGAYLVFNGKFTTGGIVAYYTYIGMMLGPIVSIFKTKLTVQRVLSSIQRIDELLTIETIEAKSSKIVQSQVDGKWARIVFNNVSFKYKDTKVVDGINIDIDREDKVAFVGSNGSGKSTLISLLLGLEVEYSGSITIDGKDIRGVSNLSDLVSVVPQEAYLFNKSVYENLSMGLNKSEESVQENLHLLGIDYVDDLNMQLSDRGNSLSGGERQRICIARALVRNTPLLILDEISNNLDALSEKKIYSTINKIYAKHTIIVATHRLGVLKEFNKIYMLKQGRIVESGSFDELVQAKNDFYEVFRSTRADHQQ